MELEPLVVTASQLQQPSAQGLVSSNGGGSVAALQAAGPEPGEAGMPLKVLKTALSKSMSSSLARGAQQESLEPSVYSPRLSEVVSSRSAKQLERRFSERAKEPFLVPNTAPSSTRDE